MKFIDALVLARTKRKTRRIRTVLVIVVSSLLFAVLFFAALLAAGFKDAAQQVKDVGFSGRNIVSVVYQGNNQGFQNDYERIISEMKNELRDRKVRVTDETERDPSFMAELGYRMNEAFTKAQQEANAKLEEQTKKLANPRTLYHFSPLQMSPQEMLAQPDPARDAAVEEAQKRAQSSGKVPPSGDPENELSFYTVEQDMMRTQLYKGQSAGWNPGDPYPMYVSYSFLEKLSGKSFARVSTDAKNKGYRELMQAYAGKELAYCYRNTAALDQLDQVARYNYEATKDDKASTKPLDMPVCSGFDQATLKKLEIITDGQDPAAKPLFPPRPTPTPETIKMSFKIVGYVPSPAKYGTTDAVTQILTGITSLPTGSYPGIIPTEVINQEPRLKRFADTSLGMPVNLFADFETREQQIAFLENGCKGDECSKGTVPAVSPFGNVGLTFAGVIRGITKFLVIAVSVVMVIAGLMIMFTISKVIADSTKEIAVFRALGARRRDIAQVYFTYGFMLAGSAVLWAFVLASIGTAIASNLYADKMAAGLVQATGAYDQSVTVVLWGIQPLWLAAIIAALTVAAFVGIGVPVTANLRRKLINALREE